MEPNENRDDVAVIREHYERFYDSRVQEARDIAWLCDEVEQLRTRVASVEAARDAAYHRMLEREAEVVRLRALLTRAVPFVRSCSTRVELAAEIDGVLAGTQEDEK